MKKKTAASLMFIMVGIAALSCLSLTIPLRKNMYVPRFNVSDFAEYKGTSVYLPSFANRADNTSIWHYFSLDKKRKYQTRNIEQFFWNCFQDAFLHVGIFVYDTLYSTQATLDGDTVREGLKEFRLQFTSLNDTEYRFIVTLISRGTIVFQRKFIIPMAPEETKNKEELEKRAFKMIDKSIRTILKDPDFKNAFLKKDVQPGAEKKGDKI